MALRVFMVSSMDIFGPAKIVVDIKLNIKGLVNC